jgi:hypothetical protein
MMKTVELFGTHTPIAIKAQYLYLKNTINKGGRIAPV